MKIINIWYDDHPCHFIWKCVKVSPGTLYAWPSRNHTTDLSTVKWSTVAQAVTEQTTLSYPDVYTDKDALKKKSR